MAAVATLAACGGGSSNDGSSDQTTTSARSSTAAAGGSSTEGGLPDDACALVTGDQIQRVLGGTPSAPPTGNNQIPGRLISCAWSANVDGNNALVTVQVKQNPNSASDYDNVATGGTSVDGIGDKATLVSSANQTDLWVLQDDILIHVTAGGVAGDPTAALEEIVTSVLAQVT